MSLNRPQAGVMNSKLAHYKQNEVFTSSPEKLVLLLYDQAILGCKKQDQGRASLALSELVNSLNFNYVEVATGLFKLYDYLLRIIKQSEFNQALDILTELRQTWSSAIQNLKAA